MSPVSMPSVDSATAWRMLAAAFVVGFVVFGIVYSFGVFLSPIMVDLGASRAATSSYYAVSSLAFYMLGPVTGRAGDRFGPRTLAMTGALALGGGLVATAFVNDVRVGLLTYGVGVGLGAACAYIPTFAILGGWFDRHRTSALGIAVAGTGCGMLVVPPLAALLIEQIGWRDAMIVLGLGSGVLLGAAAMTVAPPPASSDTPGSATLGSVVRSGTFRTLYASWILGTMALFVPLVYLPAFAVEQGVDPIAASWLISVVGGASIIGRLGIGYLQSFASIVQLYKAAVLAMAASYVMWFALPGFWWAVVFAAVLGLAYGLRIALVAPVLIAFFGLKDLGAILGAFFTATGIAGLLGPLFAGLAIDATGGHGLAILLAITTGALSFLVVLPLADPPPALSTARAESKAR
jgi:MFS family permease